jgi:H+/Cl- antiporter ClcA
VTSTPPAPPAGAPDPVELLKSRSYLALLVFGAMIGVPVAAIAYFFLKLIAEFQEYAFTTLPGDLGYDGQPTWWPLPLLALSGLLVALTIRYLPGTAGHKPAEGFKASGPVPPLELPGIVIAALVTLGLGAVLGPEAPLIAIGGGIAVLAVHLIKRDAPPLASVVVGVAGSFAAVSTLLGSPIVGAFLLMEVAGIGGPLLGVVLVPGLLAAGVGALIFVGLDDWTGFGTFSLAVPDLPPFARPDAAEFLWAIGIGLAAAALGVCIRRLALQLQPIVERRMLLLTPVAGLGIAGLAIAFAEGSDRSSSEVLFSGQDALPSLIQDADDWTVGALVLLVVCKGLAYTLSLSGFRGGPIFPGMFVGAAGGIALSHLPGLPTIAGAAMGIGALTVAMLGLPLTAVMLTILFLQGDGLALTPLVIVAVVVSYVVSARLAPAQEEAQAPAPAGASQAGRVRGTEENRGEAAGDTTAERA